MVRDEMCACSAYSCYIHIQPSGDSRKTNVSLAFHIIFSVISHSLFMLGERVASDRTDLCDFRQCAMHINFTKGPAGIFAKHKRNKKCSIFSKLFSI